MDTEIDGRLLALRQAVGIALALSTHSNARATELALELLSDLKAGMDNTPADSPFGTPPWVSGARDELDQIAHLLRAYTQEPSGPDRA